MPGYHNDVRIDSAAGLVVKRFRDPLDFTNEVEAHQVLEGTGIAPEIVDSDPDRLVIRLRFVDGGRPEPGPALQRLAELHRRFLGTRDPRVISLAGRQVSDIQRRLRGRLAPGPSTLVHGDPTPENIIDTGDRAILLDWEEARFSDPCIDLGILFIEFWGPGHPGERLRALMEDLDRSYDLIDVRTRFLAHRNAILESCLTVIDGWWRANVSATDGRYSAIREHLA